VVAGLVDLAGCRTLLDVGGGSGAFSIALCRRHPELSATILDFPSVRPTADELSDRIQFVEGDALTTPWPTGQDSILMAYLLSVVAALRVGELLDRARQSLRPGGCGVGSWGFRRR
jgi:ubiquinone/menaquinone biosynthesis C-methylase UbiE